MKLIDRHEFTNDTNRLPYRYQCTDCGGPRSVGSAERCKRCYLKRAADRRAAKLNGSNSKGVSYYDEPTIAIEDAG